MTNTEIKEVIEILKKEGCNSKKQAIKYLEEKLKTFKIGDKIFKIGDRVEITNPRYSYYKEIVTIVKIINDRYIIVESDDKKIYDRLFLEHDLMKINERS